MSSCTQAAATAGDARTDELSCVGGVSIDHETSSIHLRLGGQRRLSRTTPGRFVTSHPVPVLSSPDYRSTPYVMSASGFRRNRRANSVTSHRQAVFGETVRLISGRLVTSHPVPVVVEIDSRRPRGRLLGHTRFRFCRTRRPHRRPTTGRVVTSYPFPVPVGSGDDCHAPGRRPDVGYRSPETHTDRLLATDNTLSVSVHSLRARTLQPVMSSLRRPRGK